MSTNDSGSTAGAAVHAARDEASGLAHSAADSGQQLLHEAKDEATGVVSEATGQARDLLGEARSGLRSQASEQQAKAAASLRSLGDELGRMAEGAQEGGLAADLVRQAAGRTGSVASWLEDREPGDVLGEVAEFARRRPGMFLAIAATVGVLAGRLTRGLKDAPSGGPGAGRDGAGARAATTRPGPAASAPPGMPEAFATGGGGGTAAGTTQVPESFGDELRGTSRSGEEQAWRSAEGDTQEPPGHPPTPADQGGSGTDPFTGAHREDEP